LRRLNAIRARLTTLDWEGAPVFEINGLKREELIATGSVILHEIYFDSLGGYGDNPPTGLTEPPAELACALGRDFSSLAAWRTQFVAMAKALAGESGWAILAWSERLGRLVNHWAADHGHALPSSTPILAIDMYEHAYHLDFGARAAAYVDQVMANLNWERIGARCRRAVGERTREDELFLPYGAPAQQEARISAEELKAALKRARTTDRCSWISVSPGTCPDAPICWPGQRCTPPPPCRCGSRICRETGRLRFTVFAVSRSAARP
jgi:Fe-Mn family superoxide dismutase